MDVTTETEGVARVRAALRDAGHADTIQGFPEGTKTAADAAAAIGCTVAQIAKSIVFRAGETPVVVIASGANRVDKKKLRALVGEKVEPAGPDFVHAATGFAPGGVSPVGLAGAPLMLLDAALLDLDPVWAAAGSPAHVFRTDVEELLRLTGARIADIAQEGG